MELLQLLPLLSFLTVIIILLASCLVLKRKGRTSSSWSTSLSQNPSLEPQLPSPSRLPVIGSMHHLVGSVPHRRLCELSRRHGPLMLVRLGQVDVLVVSSPEAAEEVLKIHGTNFACRPKVGSVEFITYGYSDPIFCPYGRRCVGDSKVRRRCCSRRTDYSSSQDKPHAAPDRWEVCGFSIRKDFPNLGSSDWGGNYACCRRGCRRYQPCCARCS